MQGIYHSMFKKDERSFTHTGSEPQDASISVNVFHCFSMGPSFSLTWRFNLGQEAGRCSCCRIPEGYSPP